MPHTLVLDGTTLTPSQVTALARRRATSVVAPAARQRVTAARAAAARVTARRHVYGHTTGVGANRTTPVPDAAADTHGLRLLRSHSGGIGPLVPEAQARAMLTVRLNQVLGAGSALGDTVVDALARALAGGHVPAVHALGAIGTADLTALAELGLTLAGELPWQGGDGPAPVSVPITRWDALPLMSSSALTIGQSALATTDLRLLLDRLPLVAALTLTAVRGGTEAFAASVHAQRPHVGAGQAAARMRELLAHSDWQPALVQDPFGFRCLPQVHGAALDSWAALDSVLTIELNSSVENPLLDLAPDQPGHEDYHHHGGFHMASLALALDQFRLALLGTASLSTSRLGVLVEPAFTGGLPPFLAQTDDGSSGIMIVEYAAQSALAELRGGAQPVTVGHAVISRGVEEHASFASTGARRILEAVDHVSLVLGCELVAAVRALRMRGLKPPAGELRDFYRAAADALSPDLADRKLTDDIHTAAALLLRPT
ncbi:aromatic amino acid ammonia-lyase [Streptomyces sp. NBC_00873]|uniref:aromatic amino acid ammonia-lyase n=1 Tax=unclassified Streptomyces TaxID=2593676 RepID=UPI00386ACC24|nr:aromatic amino acid ammonia-lyase [Streptomyces sp. NBC_00873]WTA44397.1 aromatic amino acid ammonia-lyase [Streptomyces sp. NBC_00842]